MIKRVSVVLFLLVLLVSCKKDTIPPEVISTNPPNGAEGVDPSIMEISITFSEPMMDKNWSWCYEDKNKFPEMTGEPFYTENNTKNILPVKLQANTEYLIWVNLDKFNNFKDKSGNPVKPNKFVFKTGDIPKPE
jgi:hypothetical protein